MNTSVLSQYYTKIQADTLLNSKHNFVTSANSTGSGIPLLSAPQGALDNVVKTISAQSGLTLTDVLDLTTTPVDRRLNFGIDSSVVALQTDIANYMLTTDVNNALALKLDTTTFNPQIANYDTSSTVDT